MNTRKRNIRITSQKQKVLCLSYIRKRESGIGPRFDATNINSICSRLPFLWEGRQISETSCDKIFASQWLSNNNIILGTKCNQLGLLNCSNGKIQDIPLINETEKNEISEPICGCGIHAIQLNPSQSFLATGGKSVTTVGIYSLPDLSPKYIFQNHHKNCVFDLRWLDDVCLASCSRDSSLALWRLPCTEKVLPSRFSENTNDFVGCTPSAVNYEAVNSPVANVVSEHPDDRFRALEYLPTRNMFALVSMSAYFYLYDAERLFDSGPQRPFHTILLRYSDREAVALRRWPLNPHVVALATHRSVLMFDIRCSSQILRTAARCVYPPSSHASCVRSLNFSGNLISYGTSAGKVHFYDLVADKHLPIHLDVGSKSRLVNPTCERNSFSPEVIDNLPDLASEIGQNTAPIEEEAEDDLLFPFQTESVLTSENWIGQNPITWFDNIQIPETPSEIAMLEIRSRPVLSSISPTRRGLERLRVRLTRLRQTSAELNRHRDFIYRLTMNSDRSSLNESPLSDHNYGRSLNTTPEAPVNAEQFQSSSFLIEPEATAAAIFSLSAGLSTPGTNMAVYTHEYDPSGTRLFTAGGPIGSAFSGNFAVIWD